METAIDIFARKLVYASRASHYRRYTCPACGESVTLASGPKVMPHFRHAWGTVAKDCSYYRAGSETTSEKEILPEKVSREWRLPSLYIKLIINDNVSVWNLVLNISQIENRFDEILINDSQGIRRLSRTHMPSGGWQVNVLPRVDPYHLVYRGKFGTEKRSIDGLKNNYGNVFHFKQNAGRLLGGNESLTIGETYIVVCHRSYPLLPIADIKILELESRENWLAYVIHFGAKRTEALSLWCKTHLGKEILPSQPQMAVIYPLEQDVLPNGTIVLCQGEDIVLSLFSANQEFQYMELLFKQDKTGEWTPLPSAANFPAFYNLGELSPGVYEIIASNDHMIKSGYPVLHFAFEVANLTTSGLPLPASIKVGTQDYPLFTNDAENILRSVRKQDTVITDFICPSGLTVNLDTGQENQVYQFGIEDQRESIDQFLEQLSLALLQGEKTVILDADSFGNLEIAGNDRDTLSHNVCLSLDLERRINWLLANSLVKSTERCIPVQQVYSVEERDIIPDDPYGLIRRFFVIDQWPASLLPHVRAVVKDILGG